MGEQEKLMLAQKVESVEKDLAKAKDAEKQSKERLAAKQQLNKQLDARVAPLVQAAKRLKEEQQRARGEVNGISAGFSADIQKMMDAADKLREKSKHLMQQYKIAMEDRKKLHNLVLDLKGNIRVFVRTRPMNAKEKALEAEGEATIDWREDINIGVYSAEQGRRKWFEFDQCFSPATKQTQVFAEAMPLATSVLDGYNVC